MKWVGLVLLGSVILYLGVQGFLCANAVGKAYLRLESYNAKTIELSYGEMTYIDHGTGETILVVHGINGGYDQGYNAAVGCFRDKRIIAPSRFGYLASDIPMNPTPKEQARAFIELLDELDIEQVYVFATSAGGTSAIRFALDYPDRIKGLILMSSAPPLMEKPEQYKEYQGPPSAICNNYMMWLFSPFFKMTMGLEPEMIHEMLPMNERKEGMEIDATLSNPDMARNYEQYTIEEIQAKTIIFHAKDDKLASYTDMMNASKRFSNCTFVSFDDGGHKIAGHEEEIMAVLDKFMQN